MAEEQVRILLIEDDNGLRTILIELLEEKGYWVRGVPSSEDAIEMAHNNSFDLVITDIRTEGQQDGLSTLAHVRERQPEVAAVVITGYSTEDYALRAVKLKVEDYLKKPFQLNDFLQRVDLIARRKIRLKREARERAAVRETIAWFAERVARAVSFGDGFNLERYFQSVDLLLGGSGLEKNVQDEIRLAASLVVAEENDDLWNSLRAYKRLCPLRFCTSSITAVNAGTEVVNPMDWPARIFPSGLVLSVLPLLWGFTKPSR